MTRAAEVRSAGGRPVTTPFVRLVRAGLLCAAVDGLWAIVLTLIYGRTVTGLFQGIAATAFGAGMLDGGVPSALLGLGMHVSTAFTWSAVFLLLVASSPWLRRVLAMRYGVAAVAASYGPAVWIVMSAGVIPLLTDQPVAITYRWWVQALGHIPFVGLPIVWSIARGGLGGRGIRAGDGQASAPDRPSRASAPGRRRR